MEPQRRYFLDRLLGLSVVASLLGAVTPVVGYLRPLREQAASGRDLVDANGVAVAPTDIAQNGGLVGRLEGQPVLVVRRGERLLGYKAVCPHLGCVVRWNGSRDRIECPCHGGQFDLAGTVTAGPPPTGLEPIPLVTHGARIRRA